MKKLFTLCLFAFGFLLTSQTAIAQQKFSEDVNQTAKQKTIEYSRLLKADQTTQDAMFDAFREYYDKTNTLNNSFRVGTTDYNELQSKINKRLLTSLEATLNEEQFVKYLEITDQIKDE
ncbi:hypothetical protein [Mesoflavibacter profundi]|uniref:hypothetical protein n=1 Tax=Mesoflavibacter profundi TaxID=2708110 RepID=UPI00351717A0